MAKSIRFHQSWMYSVNPPSHISLISAQMKPKTHMHSVHRAGYLHAHTQLCLYDHLMSSISGFCLPHFCSMTKVLLNIPLCQQPWSSKQRAIIFVLYDWL